jgi:hypothetical protein
MLVTFQRPNFLFCKSRGYESSTLGDTLTGLAQFLEQSSHSMFFLILAFAQFFSPYTTVKASILATNS